MVVVGQDALVLIWFTEIVLTSIIIVTGHHIVGEAKIVL